MFGSASLQIVDAVIMVGSASLQIVDAVITL